MEWKPSLSIGHHLVSVSLCFSGPHLYRSVIILSVSVCVFLDRTYIDRSFICQFQFSFSGPHLYQSIIILSVSVCVHLKSGPHPYRSVIHSSYQFSSTSRFLFQYDIQSHIFSFGVQSRCAYSSRHFESLLFLHFAHSGFILLTWSLGANCLFIILFWTSPSTTHDMVF